MLVVCVPKLAKTPSGCSPAVHGDSAFYYGKTDVLLAN